MKQKNSIFSTAVTAQHTHNHTNTTRTTKILATQVFWKSKSLLCLYFLFLLLLGSTSGTTTPTNIFNSKSTTMKNTVTTDDINGDVVCSNDSDRNHNDNYSFKERVCIIGSGNWASAISIIIGKNCQKLSCCHSKVNMYVYDEMVTLPESSSQSSSTPIQEKLSTIINTKHENIKYLPNIKLPSNILAVPNLIDAIQDATLLIFCLPHQFLIPILNTIHDHYHLLRRSEKNNGIGYRGCRGVSLIKGMDYDPNNNVPILISKSIQDIIGHNFKCGVLMGANVANGVAKGQVCESTLAADFNIANDNNDDDSIDWNQRIMDIFHDPSHFRIQHTTDIYGTEACGALKNIVALGCGFVDSMYLMSTGMHDFETETIHLGLGLDLDDGSNTKAALIRIGLLEMKRFCMLFLGGVREDTFYQSCGIADLITTCYSGRNYKCAREFGCRQQKEKQQQQQQWDDTKCQSEWNDIESTFLNGQKLQGTLTCNEVYIILSSRNLLSSFPLFHTIYDIAFQGRPVNEIVDGIIDVMNNNCNDDVKRRTIFHRHHHHHKNYSNISRSKL